MSRLLSSIRRLVLGDTDFPAQCSVGMSDPQSEIVVLLRTKGESRDVTDSHVMACPSPFLIGIGAGEPNLCKGMLEFRERMGEPRPLAEIGLRLARSIKTSGAVLNLFEVRHARNHCVPPPRLLAHYLHKAFLRRRENKGSDVPMNLRGSHAMIAFFTCPRPVVLASVGREDAGSIFPMNLMGPIGGGLFAFALNSNRMPAALVGQTRRIALSGIPAEQADFVRAMGGNHRQDFAPWSRFPFATRRSAAFGLPVPDFALRVRELEVESANPLGSHTLFIAHIVRDECLSEGLQFCMIHGIYRAWRRKRLSA